VCTAARPHNLFLGFLSFYEQTVIISLIINLLIILMEVQYILSESIREVLEHYSSQKPNFQNIGLFQ
jgi:hypothetical protein